MSTKAGTIQGTHTGASISAWIAAMLKLAMWSATDSVPATGDSNDTFDHNTVQSPYLANDIAIYGGNGNTVTFTDVNIDKTGTYQMEIDYLTSGPRSFFMIVNGGASTELDLNGSSFSLPTSTVIPVELRAGSNTIQFGNATGYAPALDRIAIAPVVESAKPDWINCRQSWWP